MAERPRNVRPASILERGYAHSIAQAAHHNRRRIPEGRDDNQTGGNYHGNHRASSQHHADETPAQRRSSRVGRHHTETTEDLSGRW